ncbi:MAG: HEAT repeat domain-containing protein [Candidatus Methylomirabilota bacterium]
MDRQGQAAAAAPGTPGPPILKALEGLLIALRKSSKDLAFYPAGHPMLNRSLERAAERLQSAVAIRAPLSLVVSRVGFSFEGQPVGKENRQLASMAAELFVRRIQKIFFTEEIGPEELAGFLRVITGDPKYLVQQGGPAKVLAAHGVGHIQLNEFDFRRVAAAAGAAGRGTGGPGTAGSGQGVGPGGKGTGTGARGTAGGAEATTASAGAGKAGQGVEGTPGPAGTARPGGPASLKGAEAGREGPTTPESSVAALGSQQELSVAALIQRLEKEAASGGMAGYEWAASRLEKAAVHAVHDDWPQDLLAVLGVFLRHQRAENLQTPLRERAAKALELVAGGNTVAYLLEHLRTGADESVEALSAMLVELGGRAILPLLNRLATEDRDTAKQRLVAILARFCQVAQPDLTGILQELDRDRACQLVPILAGFGGEIGGILLTSLFRHRDPQVRSGVLRERGRFGEPAVQRLVLQALRDPDPDVLEVAVGLAGAARLRLATPTLLRLAGQRVLSGKPFAVRKAAVTALGAMGDAGTIPMLKRVLYTRAWFQRAAGDELRQAAALALLSMGRPEAGEVVVGGARSGRGGVRRVCTAALRITPAEEHDLHPRATG